MGAGQDVEYTATFEIFPSIEVKEITDLVIEKPTARSPMLMSITSLRYSESSRESWSSLSAPQKRAIPS